MNTEYFTDNCIVKNEFYIRMENFLTCPICKNIYKNPLICSNCMKSFCDKCITNKSKCESCGGSNIKYKESISKKELLSKLIYKCKNCFEEVLQSDINYHLSLNCKHKEKEERKTLNEIYNSKKELKRIGTNEIKQRLENNEKIYIIRGNSLNYFNKYYFENIVITLGDSNVGKTSLIYR